MLSPEAKSSDKECYGFKSRRAPPAYSFKNYGEHWKSLRDFESKIYDLIRSLKFSPYTNELQRKMQEDIKMINNTKDLIIPADKTVNWFRMKVEDYEKLLLENITKDYKKADYSLVEETNQRAAEIAQKLDLSDRMQMYYESPAFGSIKDHKGLNPVHMRLLNPAKGDLGKISKIIVQKINNQILAKTKLNLWRDNSSALEWFNGLQNKQQLRFLAFDIQSYYPSIKEKLLLDALEFAKKHVEIKDPDIQIIQESRRTFLFHKGEVWVKKGLNNNTSALFDVPMGCYDSAEISELCGIYMLSLMSKIVPSRCCGLYRDDGIICMKKSATEMEKIKQELSKLFQENGLTIIFEKSGKKTNFLDITFDLEEGVHRPYCKPNNRPCYVHSQSNHPPSNLEAIPQGVNRRLSKLASSREVFEQEAPRYQNAIYKSGYHHTLTYQPATSKKRRKRHRNILWFNPPFSKNCTTLVGRRFFNILQSSFPKGHPLSKIFNKTTVKMSFSTVRNMKAILGAHNARVLKDEEKKQEPCNCQRNKICPMNRVAGGCNATNLVYQVDVAAEDQPTMTYYGQTIRPFKKRWIEHKHAMANENSPHATALSNYIWKLKKLRKDFQIKCSIKSRAAIFKNGSKRCSLCLKEKVAIATHSPRTLLNSKSEILHKCIHASKYELRNATKARRKTRPP